MTECGVAALQQNVLKPMKIIVKFYGFALFAAAVPI